MKLHTLTVLGLLGVLGACASDEPPAPASVLIEENQNVKTEKDEALLIDPATKIFATVNAIKVLKLTTTTVNDKIVLQLDVLNDRGRRDVVNYRVRWLDSLGMQAAPYSEWKVLALEGKERQLISETAPNNKAVDFRIEMQTNN